EEAIGRDGVAVIADDDPARLPDTDAGHVGGGEVGAECSGRGRREDGGEEETLHGCGQLTVMAALPFRYDATCAFLRPPLRYPSLPSRCHPLPLPHPLRPALCSSAKWPPDRSRCRRRTGASTSKASASSPSARPPSFAPRT